MTKQPRVAPSREEPRSHERSWPLVPAWLRAYPREWLGLDVLAGGTLAAIAIPEGMGYATIAGMPVVAGLYTMLLPSAAFAIGGSSRHLVVGADSATAAILFAGLSGLAAPYSPRWLALASASALLTAALLIVARLLRLGFLANFLSRTVLIGFLGGVGITVLGGQIPDMLGVTVRATGFVQRMVGTAHALSGTNVPTLGMALAVLALLVVGERVAPKAPTALVAVIIAIAATWIFRLDQHGVAVVGRVSSGLPALGPPPVSLGDLTQIVPTAASMFLVIVAQSAATARSFAQRYDESLDEDRDLVALGVANALSGISGAFVVNGSPTKTAVVTAAGGRTQVAQLVAAGAVLVVLLVATPLIARLPVAVLAAIVSFIAARLVDVRAFRRIVAFRKVTFAVAVGTMVAVVALGVERGILLAIGLSVLDHLQREYRPNDVVLVLRDGRVRARKADPGVETEPGLLVYRFEARLFFANADYFAMRLQSLVQAAAHPITWLVLDLVGTGDVDYTAGLILVSSIERLQRAGITVALAQAEDIRDPLDRLGITERIGLGRMFESVQDAIDAYHEATSGTRSNA